MEIKIKNLLLRTIIGFKDWEREKKQDILINITIFLEDVKAIKTGDVKDSLDYKVLNKKIIERVEKTEFFLIEKLADFILDIIFEDLKVKKATVEIDKPYALRFADSVSVKLERKR